MSNIPHEATEDDIRKFMHTIRIEALHISDAVATMKVSSLKDVGECLTYDTKYLYYKEVQVRRAPSDTIVPVKPPKMLGSKQVDSDYDDSYGALRMRGLPFKATDDEIIGFFAGYDIIPTSIKYKLDD